MFQEDLCNAEETVTLDLELTPWRSGPAAIVAAFNSEELYNLTGTRMVTVVS